MRELIYKTYPNSSAPLCDALLDLGQNYEKAVIAGVCENHFIGSDPSADTHRNDPFAFVGGAMDDLAESVASKIRDVPWASIPEIMDQSEQLQNLGALHLSLRDAIHIDGGALQQFVRYTKKRFVEFWEYVKQLFGSNTPSDVSRAIGETSRYIEKYFYQGVTWFMKFFSTTIFNLMLKAIDAVVSIIHKAASSAAFYMQSVLCALMDSSVSVAAELRSKARSTLIFMAGAFFDRSRIGIDPVALKEFDSSFAWRVVSQTYDILSSKNELDLYTMLNDDILRKSFHGLSNTFSEYATSISGSVMVWIMRAIRWLMSAIVYVVDIDSIVIVSCICLSPALAKIFSSGKLDISAAFVETKTEPEDERYDAINQNFQEIRTQLIGPSPDIEAYLINSRMYMDLAAKTQSIPKKMRDLSKQLVKLLDNLNEKVIPREITPDQSLKDAAEFARLCTAIAESDDDGDDIPESLKIDILKFATQRNGLSSVELTKAISVLLPIISSLVISIHASIVQSSQSEGEKKKKAFMEFGRPRKLNNGLNADDLMKIETLSEFKETIALADTSLKTLAELFQMLTQDVESTIRSIQFELDPRKDARLKVELRKQRNVVDQMMKALGNARGTSSATRRFVEDNMLDTVRDSLSLKLHLDPDEPYIDSQMMVKDYAKLYFLWEKWRALRNEINKRSSLGRSTRNVMKWVLLLAQVGLFFFYVYYPWFNSRTPTGINKVMELRQNSTWSFSSIFSSTAATVSTAAFPSYILDDFDVRTYVNYVKLLFDQSTFDFAIFGGSLVELGTNAYTYYMPIGMGIAAMFWTTSITLSFLFTQVMSKLSGGSFDTYEDHIVSGSVLGQWMKSIGKTLAIIITNISMVLGQKMLTMGKTLGAATSISAISSVFSFTGLQALSSIKDGALGNIGTAANALKNINLSEFKMSDEQQNAMSIPALDNLNEQSKRLLENPTMNTFETMVDSMFTPIIKQVEDASSVLAMQLMEDNKRSILQVQQAVSAARIGTKKIEESKGEKTAMI